MFRSEDPTLGAQFPLREQQKQHVCHAGDHNWQCLLSQVSVQVHFCGIMIVLGKKELSVSEIRMGAELTGLKFDRRGIVGLGMWKKRREWNCPDTRPSCKIDFCITYLCNFTEVIINGVVISSVWVVTYCWNTSYHSFVYVHINLFNCSPNSFLSQFKNDMQCVICNSPNSWYMPVYLCGNLNN